MQTDHKSDPFTQYSLKKYHTRLDELPDIDPKVKVTGLVEGCMVRNRLKLYKGEKSYTEDLQVVLDHDRELAPLILKEMKIMVSKNGAVVLVQCTDCGRHMPPFHFCQKCQHIHYCSQACEVRSKLSHQAVCRPKHIPSIDAALQIEVHVGSDLGREVEVYYQHQMRMSLKIRGEAYIGQLFDYFIGEGKSALPEDCRPEIKNSHLRMRRTLQSAQPTASGKSFVPQTLEDLVKVYSQNLVLSNIVIRILKKGGIMSHLIRQIHNNHLHLIYIFLSP